MSNVLPEKELIRSTIIKLLEKANRHPSLTPKLLRNKLEEKLKLQPGCLSAKKIFIKKIALQWWVSGESTEMTPTQLALKRLTKLATVAGKMHLFKSLGELSEEEKISLLREK